MGFLSWKTADTGESIYNRHSQNGAKTVYLLQPDGNPPIEERRYEGYGEFGGVDTNVWLAKNNIFGAENMNEEELANLGYMLDVNYYVDKNTGTKYGCGVHIDINTAKQHKISLFGNYATVHPDYGKDINALIKDGIFERHEMSEVLLGGDGVKYPLKFSFDKNAVYEDCPASEVCPNQGLFVGNQKNEMFEKIFGRDGEEHALAEVQAPSRSK